MYFEDRRHAGRLLAAALGFLRGEQQLLVLGIPRGGIVVAAEIAKALHAPLDVYIVRKIGAPYNPEMAIGAVASDGTVVLDQPLIAHLNIPAEYVHQETERQRKEIERRSKAYRGTREEQPITGKAVVLIDDGVATGSTVLAALRAIRQKSPARLVLAVPVGPPESIRELSKEADQVICLETPESFWAVGAYYAVFDQTSDAEVIMLLDESAQQ